MNWRLHMEVEIIIFIEQYEKIIFERKANMKGIILAGSSGTT